MKNMKTVFYSFFALGLFAFMNQANAFINPFKGGIPSLGIPDKPALGVVIIQGGTMLNSVNKSINTVKDLASGEGINIDNSGAVASEVKGLNVTDGNEKKLNKTAKKLKKTKVADIYDEKSVSDALYKMFMVQPSDNRKAVECYDLQRGNFYKDTVIELYAVSREMEASLPDLEAELEKVIDEINNGGGSVGEISSNGDALDANYQASELLDRVARMTEELTAMNIQVEMVTSMRDGLPAFTKKEAEEVKELAKETKKTNKSSSLFLGNKYAKTTAFAFAQLSEDEETFNVNDFTTYNEVTAPDPKIYSPFAGNEENLDAVKNLSILSDELDKGLSLHNLSTQLLSYRDIFEEYEKMKKLHQKALDILTISDQCSINYIGKYYEDPENVWAGGHLGSMVNSPELRQGVSKWLIDSYDVAKSQMTASTTIENVATMASDSTIDREDIDKGTEGAKKTASSQDLENSLSETDLKKEAAEGRDVDMLSWKIGAELSRDLVSDQYGESKWGKIKSEFPLWNDQKKYYDLYIDGKYNNILEYFTIADLRDVEVSLARAINREKGENNEKEYAEKAQKENPLWNSDLKTAISKASYTKKEGQEEWHAEVDKEILGMEAQQKTLEAKRKMLEKLAVRPKELDNVIANERWLASFKEEMEKVSASEELSKYLLEELKKDQEAVGTVESETNSVFAIYDEKILSIKAEKEAATLVDEKALEKANEDLKLVKEDISKYNKAINIEEEAKIEAEEEGTTYKAGVDTKLLAKRVETAKKEKARLEKLILELENKITATKKEYDKKIADEEVSFQKQLNELAEVHRNREYSPLSGMVSTAAKTANLAGASSTLLSSLSQATSVINGFKTYATDVVMKTRNAIFELGDDLYFQKSNEVVNKQHQEMVQALREIPYEKFLAISNMNITQSILTVLNEVIDKYMLVNVCENDSCFTPDEEYFLGLVGKARDFQAPKAPFTDYMPPIRETFYFDEENYTALFDENNYVKEEMLCDEMKKTGDIVSDVKVEVRYTINLITRIPEKKEYCIFKKYYISKTALLDSEIYLPNVWRIVLDSRPFVEKNIDLKDFLKSEDDAANSAANADFLRGGIYPCKTSAAIIDVSDEAKYIMGTEALEELPECQLVEISKKSYYATLRDVEENLSGSVGVGKMAPRFSSSELGFMFSSDNEHLFFRNTVHSVFKRILEIRKQQEEGKKEYKPTMTDLIYERGVLKRSQFGDFIEMSRRESELRKNVEELKIEVDKSKEDLFESLKDVGFEPSPDLNLADQSDFDLVKKTLHNKKFEIINDVSRKLSNYSTILNSVVQERVEQVKNLSNALMKDSEELISMSRSEQNLSELEEDIKSEKVNIEVREGYKKTANEAFEKELNEMVRAYCASY
ncbi:MAG: hypothetical protein PHE89_02325 [Alphaproteobacteria bacterium]|nr:hypothetical protein [Alphaproteobacteria bacterium]